MERRLPGRFSSRTPRRILTRSSNQVTGQKRVVYWRMALTNLVCISTQGATMRLNFLGFLRSYLVLILFAVSLRPAFASFRPSFDLDYCSWNATHIVLVATTPQGDVFEVIESWRGNLNAGDHIMVPELEPASNAIPIALYLKQFRPNNPSDSRGIGEIPRQPVGSRMVLFLKQAREVDPASGLPNGIRVHEWQSADVFHEMRASVIWVDGTQLYRFMQWTNPGPSLLSPWDTSLAKVQGRVTEVIRIQQGIAAVLNVREGGTRAEHLKPYVQSDLFPARRLALEELGKCGPAALGTIREMMDNPAFAHEVEDLIKAYSEAGGKAAGEELNARFREALSFWRATGPTLSPGWWNQDVTPHAPLRERYGQTIQLIRGLELTHYSAALSTAIQLRDLWRSLPQLNDPSGLNQMVEECDKLVDELRAN